MDVMLDLETFGNTPQAAINQIGAVAFDRYTGEVIGGYKVNIDAQTCIDLGMTMDVSTINWWLKQSEAARQSITSGDKQHIKTALRELNEFIQAKMNVKDDHQAILWCHATFDEPILSNAYKACNIRPFWKYRNVRDLRTIVDLAEYNVPKDQNSGVAHDALDDCLFQIKYTVECINRLRNANTISA